ncbi:unnamed protein product [Lota lota]
MAISSAPNGQQVSLPHSGSSSAAERPCGGSGVTIDFPPSTEEQQNLAPLLGHGSSSQPKEDDGESDKQRSHLHIRTRARFAGPPCL